MVQLPAPRPEPPDHRRPAAAIAARQIQPDGWLAEYTTELLNVLHVLGRLVALEPRQADLLTRICDGTLLSAEHLRSEGAFDAPNGGRTGNADSRQVELLR